MIACPVLDAAAQPRSGKKHREGIMISRPTELWFMRAMLFLAVLAWSVRLSFGLILLLAGHGKGWAGALAARGARLLRRRNGVPHARAAA